jgi:hypothetical protein
MTVADVWAAIRETENAYRFVGDLLLGLIRQEKLSLDRPVHGSGGIPMPQPLCTGPRCTCTNAPWCDIPVREVGSLLNDLSERVALLNLAFNGLLEDLHGVREIHYNRTTVLDVNWLRENGASKPGAASRAGRIERSRQP